MLLMISSCSLTLVPPDAAAVELHTLEPNAPAAMEYLTEVPTAKRRLRFINVIYGAPTITKAMD